MRSFQVAPNAPQYPTGPKLGAPGGSPQYRAPFPQLSPQMSSPRPQMSPRPPPPQMSPRPVMSPAKPNVSPHPQMQQTTLSPRPASSLTPKSTTASPVSMPPYSQQSTLQALEQMVMPPSSANNADYSSYQQRTSLQNPLSPVMGMRNPMAEQQQHWQPQPQPPPRSHLSGMNGMGMMDQNQMPPQSQPLVPTGTNLQSSAQPIAQTLEASYGSVGEELSKNTLQPMSPAPVVVTASAQDANVSPLISQSDFGSTSMIDKPSSTTNIVEMNVPTSSNEILHSVTPTPSSTTDDNTIGSNQEAAVHSEQVKPIEDSSNSSSMSMQQQPTQSQSNTSSFTDFTSISSMTNYSSASVAPVVQAPKTNMDDLMPTSMPTYGNDSNDSTSLNITITPTQPATNSTPQIPQHQVAQPPILQNPILPMQPTAPSAPPPQPASQNVPQAPVAPPVSAVVPPPVLLGQVPNLIPPPHSQYDQTVLPMGPPRPLSHMTGHPGMPMTMGMGMDMGYQPPISHHQERAALQQQLQELYCMPPAPEHQDKITHLQERLTILAQHEATEQCNGGPQCVLQSPLFTSPMIDSPQVTSTTGRGRSKGTPRAKKPRQKKSDKDVMAAMTTPIGMMLQPLPVSEELVTPGAGLTIPSGDMADLGIDPITGELDLEKQKKTKSPRKPREPKKPKPPKEKKEKKPKEAKDGKPKRKYVRKKKDGEEVISADERSLENFAEIQSLDEQPELPESSEIPDSQEQPLSPDDKPEESLPIPESTNSNDESTTETVQADSQTPSLAAEPDESGEAVKDEYTFDDQASPIDGEIGKMPKIAKRSKPAAAKKEKTATPKVPRSSSRSSGSSRVRKSRKLQLTESDGEGEDMATTPPPSPPEDDNSTTKRRSARNTQRKKYIDDVMLRFSDEDSPSVSSKSKKQGPPALPAIPQPASAASDVSEEIPLVMTEGGNKPNFVYVNTTDEDAMVVQYVLSSRMSKREVRKDEIKLEPKQPEDKESDEEKPVEETKEPPPAEEEKLETVVIDVEEYYVKYRNFSYLHCEWRTEDELFKGDKRIANKIKRFKQKQQQQTNIFDLDDEPFNPDYIEVDRVLDVAEHTDPNTQETIKHYLVKWRSLQYEDSTWELEEDVDPLKIQLFETYRAVPPKDKWKPKKRPHPDSWEKLENSPKYKGGNMLREYQLEGRSFFQKQHFLWIYCLTGFS